MPYYIRGTRDVVPPPFGGGWGEALEGDGAVAHTGGRSQRRQSSGDDARYHLQNGLPSVLFHVNVCSSWL